MKKRLLKSALPIAIVLAVGLLYALFINLTGFTLFCPINKYFGIYCPGCGVSRMCLSILKLDFCQAFSSNCLVFCLLPVGAVIYGKHLYTYIRYGKRGVKGWEFILVFVVVALFLIFTVVRNLYPIDILIP